MQDCEVGDEGDNEAQCDTANASENRQNGADLREDDSQEAGGAGKYQGTDEGPTSHGGRHLSIVKWLCSKI